MNTHLLEWLPGAYDHCKYGSRDWCEGYLNNAVDTIRELQAANTALTAERTSLIDTKREQLAALTAERDMWRAQALRGGS